MLQRVERVAVILHLDAQFCRTIGNAIFWRSIQISLKTRFVRRHSEKGTFCSSGILKLWRTQRRIYALLGSCRRHGLNPFDCLKDLFTRLPLAKNHRDQAVHASIVGPCKCHPLLTHLAGDDKPQSCRASCAYNILGRFTTSGTAATSGKTFSRTTNIARDCSAERRFATAIFRRTLDRLKDKYARSGRADLFAELEQLFVSFC